MSLDPPDDSGPSAEPPETITWPHQRPRQRPADTKIHNAADTPVFDFEVDEGPESVIIQDVTDPATASSPAWRAPVEPPGDRPSSFGKYEILCEVGRGGMGVVYQARHKELDRIVAIKMILASHLASPEQVERFYAEARAAARLRSPNIVGIHDVGQVHGHHYFAMDYVPGPSLAEVLHRGPLDPDEAARLMVAIAGAVAQLHEHGVLHRDLKPSNVLLDAAGQPCVTDFGLAKILQSDGRMTRTGAIVGTPGYMAPEQAAGRASEVGPLSDVYSLGAILYELITGRPPFSGETPLDTLVQVLESEPIRPSRLRPGIPRALELICLKCLERAPQDRYPSARALAEDLERFLRREQLEVRREGILSRLRRWSRREPALVSRLGTMALCGTIVEVNQRLIQANHPGPPREAIAVVLLWALASIGFQAMLNRQRWADLARYAWAAADVILYTLLVLLNDGLSTSLVAGYFLLVVASGLWFREHLVWITTGMSVLGYGVLVLAAGLTDSAQSGAESPYRHVIFVSALAVSGLITSYQVKRVRALSLYYENRPLP